MSFKNQLEENNKTILINLYQKDPKFLFQHQMKSSKKFSNSNKGKNLVKMQKKTIDLITIDVIMIL